MRIKLFRRHGANQAGRTYDYDELMGQWLIDHGFGHAAGEKPADEEKVQRPDAKRPRTTSARSSGGGTGSSSS